MLDLGPRLAMIKREAADPRTAVLLLDVVLGHGAHPDPAAELAPAIRAARQRPQPLSVVVALVGTRDDPQDLADRHRYCGTRAHGCTCPTPPRPATPSPGPRRRIMSAPLHGLLDGEPVVVTVGATALADALSAQAAPQVRVDWRPPPVGTEDDLVRVAADLRREKANAAATSRMLAAGASLVDVRPAADLIGLGPGQFCHAGPPLDWATASGPMRGALIGAMLLEGLASDPDDAARQLAAGRLDDGTAIELIPCHDRGGVGPMAGVVSASMWAWVLRDEVHGNTSWCTLNEGLGKVLRYGAYGAEVIERLEWMGSVLGPTLAAALRTTGPIDAKALVGQMVQMGDEGHNRNRGGTLMLLRDLLPSIVDSGLASARPHGWRGSSAETTTSSSTS
jgi:hypothetical protein